MKTAPQDPRDELLAEIAALEERNAGLEAELAHPLPPPSPWPKRLGRIAWWMFVLAFAGGFFAGCAIGWPMSQPIQIDCRGPRTD
jgi:hypothetical protein